MEAPASTAPDASSSDDGKVRPFSIDFPDGAIDDLHGRIRAARLPGKETVEDHTQGVQLATTQALLRYWDRAYDMARLAERLNALPQFVTEIDGLDIHFIHVKSAHDGALPLIITHGWPGSGVEMLEVIGPLTDPTAHSGRAEDAFGGAAPARLRLLRPAGVGRLGSGPHGAGVGRTHEPPRLHPLRRPGRRRRRRRDRHDGAPGAGGASGHSPQLPQEATARSGGGNLRRGACARRTDRGGTAGV
jgi:Epoxide hydrolase N terminus